MPRSPHPSRGRLRAASIILFLDETVRNILIRYSYITIPSGNRAFCEPEEPAGKTCIAVTNLPPRPMMGIESCGMLLSAIHREGEEEKLHLLLVDPHIPAGAKLY